MPSDLTIHTAQLANDEARNGAKSRANRKYDVIVIGAGVAGLAAANKLRSDGYEGLVLEARETIGGRIETLPGEMPIDLGASWVHGPRKNPIGALLQEAGARLHKNDWDSVVYYHETQEIDDCEHYDDFYEYIEARKKRKRGKDESLAAALEAFVAESGLRGFDASFLRHVIGAEIENDYPTDMSQLSLLNFNEEEELKGGDHFVTGGYDLCLGALARDLDILVRTPVTRIEDEGTSVAVSTVAGTFRAAYAIVTIPLKPLATGGVAFSPPLSAEKKAAFSGLRMGNLHKTFLEFETPFWDSEEIVSIMRGEERWREFLNLTEAMGRPVLLALHAGRAATALMTTPHDAIAREAVAALRCAYPDATMPLRVTTSGWEQDPYIGGSYSFVAVGGSLKLCDVLAKPHGRVHFAGEHTNCEYNGTVHGAYFSGLRAAREVVDRLPRTA